MGIMRVSTMMLELESAHATSGMHAKTTVLIFRELLNSAHQRLLVLLPLYQQVHPQVVVHPLLIPLLLHSNLLLLHLKYATQTSEELRSFKIPQDTFKSLKFRCTHLAATLLKERAPHSRPNGDLLELTGLWMGTEDRSLIQVVTTQLLGLR